MDAGMGARLIAEGLDPRRDDPCSWNLDRPGCVLAVHRRDAGAGARVLLTNTFGANRAWLGRSRRQGDIRAINRAGAELARRAAGPCGFVFGDIGPSAADEAGAVAEQAAILVDAGVDALILETFEAGPAIEALRQIGEVRRSRPVPLLVSLWRWPDDAGPAARRLLASGAAVLGLNCRPGPSGVLSIVRGLAGAVACPLLVKPGVADDDAPASATPAAFAAIVPRLLYLTRARVRRPRTSGI